MCEVVNRIPFPNAVKEIIENSVNKCKVNITYIDAPIINFKIFNINIMLVFKIILYKGNNLVEILYTGKDIARKEQFYLSSLDCPITLKDIISIAEDMED